MCEILDLRSLAARELPALCEFGMKSKVPAGFGYLGPEGAVMPEMGAQLWINCRMIHMFSLFALAGIHPEQSRELAAHCANTLWTENMAGGFRGLTRNLMHWGSLAPILRKAPVRKPMLMPS